MKLDRQAAAGFYVELSRFLRADDEEWKFDSAKMPRYDMAELEAELTEWKARLMAIKEKFSFSVPYHFGETTGGEIPFNVTVEYSEYSGKLTIYTSLGVTEDVTMAGEIEKRLKEKTIPLPKEVQEFMDEKKADIKAFWDKHWFYKLVTQKDI